MAAKTSSRALLATMLLCCSLMSTAHGSYDCGDGPSLNQNHKRAAILRRRRQMMKAGGALAAEEHGDLVTRTCANATSDFCIYQVSATACESALRSDNRSAHAKDARDLALIAIDLVRLSAVATDDKFSAEEEKLKKKGNDEVMVHTLQYCRMEYATVAQLVPECRAVVAQPNPNSNIVEEYTECLDRLKDMARSCEKYIPLEKEEVFNAAHEVVQRIYLADALVLLVMFDDVVGHAGRV
jgi:hypothetical protein